MREGLLLTELGGLKGPASREPWWCPAADRSGFLIGWSSLADHAEKSVPLQRWAHPG